MTTPSRPTKKRCRSSPASAQALKHLADALEKRGQFDRAVAAIGRRLWFAPDYVDAHCALGGAIQLQGNIEQAVEYYRRAM